VGDFYFGPAQTLFADWPEKKIQSRRSGDGRNFLLLRPPSRDHGVILLSPQKKITPSLVLSVGDFYFGPAQTLFADWPEKKIQSRRSGDGRNFLLLRPPSRDHGVIPGKACLLLIPFDRETK
jgi:hypothetical protein